jgi:hypothetical protein
MLNFCSSYFLNPAPSEGVSEVTMDDAALLLLIGAASNATSELSSNKENTTETLVSGFASQLSQSHSQSAEMQLQTVPEKPYVCPQDGCEGAFKRKAHLEMHIRIHTDERPFVCSFNDCGKSFRSKSHLNTHKRYVGLLKLTYLKEFI